MARICGVCKLAFREGTEGFPMRLRPGDKEDVEEGLYSGCGDCVAEHRERIAVDLELPVESVTNHMLC